MTDAERVALCEALGWLPTAVYGFGTGDGMLAVAGKMGERGYLIQMSGWGDEFETAFISPHVDYRDGEEHAPTLPEAVLQAAYRALVGPLVGGEEAIG